VIEPKKPFDEVYETLPGDGWLLRSEAECLYRWACAGEGPILEVGCFKGRSTVLLAASGRPVTCVDPFNGFDSDDPTGDKAYEAFRRNLMDRGYWILYDRPGLMNLSRCGELGSVRKSVHLWMRGVEDWPVSPMTMAYLDGDHTERGTRIQIEKALEAGAKVIAVHDVNDSGAGERIKHVCLKMLGLWKERIDRLAVWERP